METMMPARSTGGLRVEREPIKRTPKPKTVAVPVLVAEDIEKGYAEVDTMISGMNLLLDGRWEYDRQIAELNVSISDLGRISRMDYRDEFRQVYAGTYDALGTADE